MEKSTNVLLNTICWLIKTVLLIVPCTLCLIGGIQGKYKYMRLAMLSIPIFIASIVFASWLMISNPGAFMVDAFGTASGAVTLQQDISKAVRYPKQLDRYGVNSAVSMAGNAIGIKKTNNAKGVLLAPIKWVSSLWRLI